MRSYLFVPAAEPRKIEKALSSGADMVIVDLEDSVALDRKDEARRIAHETLLSFENSEAGPKRAIRVNSLDSSWIEDDITMAVAVHADTIVLPKSTGGADILSLSSLLSVAEAEANLSDLSTRVIAVATETADSIFGLGTYGDKSKRLYGMTWGAEDLSAAIGASGARTSSGSFREPFRLVRNLCLFGAVSADVNPIDTVFTNFKDLQALHDECVAAAGDGFVGKLAIHPAQVPVINKAFMPTSQELELAQKIVEAFEANPGAGTVGLDGEMIDIPHLKRSQRLLERAAQYKG